MMRTSSQTSAPEPPTLEEAPLPLPRGTGESSLVLVFGQQLGHRWKLSGSSILVGRTEECDVVLPGDNVSRLHARLREDEAGWVVEDLGSRNGTRVNGEAIGMPRPLRNGDLVAIGRNVLKFLGGDSVETLYHEEMYRLASVDALTQVRGRRLFLEALEFELARCGRHHRPCGLLVADLDRFKELNDELGHLAGDSALRDLAATLQVLVRRDAVVGRLGGDAFGIVVPDAERDELLLVGERVRRMVSERELRLGGQLRSLTVSIGIAVSPPVIAVAARMLEAADERLRAAKRAGRNRVAG